LGAVVGQQRGTMLRELPAGCLEPRHEQIFVINNPHHIATLRQGVHDVFTSLGHLEQWVAEHIGGDFKDDIRCVGGMDGLLADLAVELTEYGAHCTHPLFLAIFSFIPYISGFQHAYIHLVRMFSSIALGGGGVRGGIMIGGLAALEKHQQLVFPKGIYGCSAGSIIATALAYNVPVPALKLMFSTDFNLSTVIPSVNLATITSFTTEKALFPMDAFGQTILKAFDNQGIDLRNAVIDDAPQKLYIMTANLTTRRTVFLSGKVPILDALKASCCLPFIFHPQILYNNVYIDGGFYVHNMHTVVPHDCLVFHISRSELRIHPERLKKMTISDYAATLYESFRSESQTENVLWFKNDTISLMQELTETQKAQLYDEGFTQASRFLAKRLPEVLC